MHGRNYIGDFTHTVSHTDLGGLSLSLMTSGLDGQKSTCKSLTLTTPAVVLP
jgi:hypothetical protein